MKCEIVYYVTNSKLLLCNRDLYGKIMRNRIISLYNKVEFLSVSLSVVSIKIEGLSTTFVFLKKSKISILVLDSTHKSLKIILIKFFD